MSSRKSCEDIDRETPEDRDSTVSAGTMPVHAAGRRGGEQPAGAVRKAGPVGYVRRNIKNFAEPELALLLV